MLVMPGEIKNEVVEEQEEVIQEEIVKEKEKEEILEEVEEEVEETPLYLQEEEESEEEPKSDTVPLAAHLRKKQKYKDEIQALKDEIESLKQRKPEVKSDDLKIPEELDFDDPVDYRKALNDYNVKVSQRTFESYEKERRLREESDRLLREREEAVNEHYKRAEILLQKHSISPEVYKNSEKNVRDSVELIMPGMGESITDSLISIIGDDSEKAMLYLGRNKSALAEFTMLLQKDKTGLKAAAYLGKIAGKVNNNVKRQSKAPAPAPKTDGEQGKVSNATLMRKYNDAHKKGDISSAYKIKKEAKQNGFDTSKW